MVVASTVLARRISAAWMSFRLSTCAVRSAPVLLGGGERQRLLALEVGLGDGLLGLEGQRLLAGALAKRHSRTNSSPISPR
jgi:hypothetical protein